MAIAPGCSAVYDPKGLNLPCALASGHAGLCSTGDLSARTDLSGIPKITWWGANPYVAPSVVGP